MMFAAAGFSVAIAGADADVNATNKDVDDLSIPIRARAS
jgi:hypothetical protein